MQHKQTLMDDLWQQFHRLPKAIRDAVARPEALAAVDSLEQRYPSLDLASFVMRAAVKEFPVTAIPQQLMDEFQLDQSSAEAVDTELRETVFAGLEDYLGPLKKAARPVEAIIRPVPTMPPPNLPIEPEPPAPAPVPVQPVKPLPAPSEQITTPAQNLASLRRPAAVEPAPVSTPPVSPVKPVLVPPPPMAAPAKVTPLPPLNPATLPRPVTAPPPPAPPSGFPNTQFSTPQKPIGAIAPTQEYSDEDAQEIAQQARRLQALATPAATGLDQIAQNIIAQHHLAFHDELLSKRAIAILKARLKQIRNAEETQVMLVRGPKVGGLGLDPDIAKQVVASLESQAKTVKDQGMVRAPDVIGPPPPPAMPPIKSQQPIPNPPLFRDEISAAARPGVLASTTPTPVVTPPSAPPAIKRPADIPSPPTLPAPQPVRAPLPKPAPMVRRERTIDRPAVADITRPMKMLGPAEEMRTMTLMEFRRLGQGANESTARLLEKFHQLQNESFTLWADALSGWRQSEVYQLYLEMGRQSLEQAIGISEVVRQRAAANQLYLSEHEFTALADFNRQLQS